MNQVAKFWCKSFFIRKGNPLHDLLSSSLKLQLHEAIYLLRLYLNSLIHILSLSNSHNSVASIQKNRGDKSHRVIVALLGFGFINTCSFFEGNTMNHVL